MTRYIACFSRMRRFWNFVMTRLDVYIPDVVGIAGNYKGQVGVTTKLACCLQFFTSMSIVPITHCSHCHNGYAVSLSSNPS